MSGEQAEKRFDATPSRRERAKRDGQVARSHEASSSAAFIAALAGLVAVLPLMLDLALHDVRRMSAAPAAAIAVAPIVPLLVIAFVPAACAGAGAVLITLAQTGGLHLTALSFSPGKLAPCAGLRRMFGAEAAIGAVRAIVAFSVVAAAIVPLLKTAILAAAGAQTLTSTADIVRDALIRACCSAAAAGGVFAFADYALVRRRWLRSLKMTFDEFRRDAKDQDGDPHAKSRRRSLHRTFARGGIARVREASFVIANPTHIAIAIRYAPPAVPVPQILVRAADALALEVRAIAERAGIPVIADVPLARMLWKIGAAGRPIPPESFVAVATTIAALIRAGVIAE